MSDTGWQDGDWLRDGRIVYEVLKKKKDGYNSRRVRELHG